VSRTFYPQSPTDTNAQGYREVTPGLVSTVSTTVIAMVLARWLLG
jgi:hypothetical protein